MKIEKLTKEQEALIPVIREKWIKIGLSTGTNKGKAEEGIAIAYRMASLSPPKKIEWFPSPVGIKRLNQPIIYGQHEAGWLSFYDFFLQIGIKECEKLRGLMQVAESACWWVPTEGVCYISEKAVVTKVDEANRLHAVDGPAIAYSDGFALYRWHGVNIPKEFITSPDSIDLVKINNQEQKRALCEILGWEKVMEKLGARSIQRDDFGELFELASLNDLEGKPARLVRFKCSSTGRVYIQLTAATTKTAHAAIAATFRLSPEQYHPVIET